MTNANYIKGRNKEYKVRKKLLASGWPVVVRSAGSHSPFDLIAIKPPFYREPKDAVESATRLLVNGQISEPGEILLIQCKPDDSPYERNRAWNQIKEYGGVYNVVVSVY